MVQRAGTLAVLGIFKRLQQRPRNAKGSLSRPGLVHYLGDGEDIISALSAVVAPALPRALRPADWDTIGRATRAGLALGVHSATHRTLTELDDVELEREVVASWETIRRRLGGHPEIFAYPYGRWNARARDAVRAAGYGGAVTLDYGLVRPDADPWALPRVSIPASISQLAFQAWAAGLAPRHGHG